MCTTGLLERLQERTQYCRTNIGEITLIVISSYKSITDEMVVLNQNQLYKLGEDIQKLRLAPYKSVYYAEYKFNLRGDGKELTDLFKTGAFQLGFYVYFQGEMYGIDSTDEKTSALIEKYGENIFGLTEENKEVTYFILKPYLQERVLEILNGAT